MSGDISKFVKLLRVAKRLLITRINHAIGIHCNVICNFEICLRLLELILANQRFGLYFELGYPVDSDSSGGHLYRIFQQLARVGTRPRYPQENTACIYIRYILSKPNLFIFCNKGKDQQATGPLAPDTTKERQLQPHWHLLSTQWKLVMIQRSSWRISRIHTPRVPMVKLSFY